MPAEADLVEGLKGGDSRAFEQLINDYGGMLYRVASRFVGQQEAEEVLQDSLLAVYEKIRTFDGRSALGTWLYRVVVNAALMRLRSRSRSREETVDPGDLQFTDKGEFREEVADWALPPEDALLRQEGRSLLRQSIEALPETYRTVYVLAEIEGLAHQEIAAILDLTVATVKTRLHRARLILREALESYFVKGRRKNLEQQEAIA